MTKITLADKYNTCVALNIELEEIIEMQNKQIYDLEKQIFKLEEDNKYWKNEVISLENQLRG